MHVLLFYCFRKAALLVGWAVFLLLAYKVSKLDREYQEYNPYEILNLDPVSKPKHIRTFFCRVSEVLRDVFYLLGFCVGYRKNNKGLLKLCGILYFPVSL